MSLRGSTINLLFKLRISNVCDKRYFFWKSKPNVLKDTEETPVFEEIPEQIDATELKRMRNKSRLNHEHRNIVHDKRPYNRPMASFHNTVKYKKRMLGRYGLEALEVPAGIAWPTQEEVEQIKEYEKYQFPLTIQERLSKILEEKRLHEESIMARQKVLESNMAKMESMITEMQEKVAKKEEELRKAQLKKQQKIEEIKRKLLEQGQVTEENIEKELSEMSKQEKKQKKEAKKAKILEKQKAYVKKLMESEAKQQEEAAEDQEQSKEDKN